MIDTRDKGSGVVRSAGAFGAATLLSRVAGMIRDMVIAALFAAADTDAFFMAFTIPNVLRRLFGEGSLNAAIVPVYTEAEVNGGPGASVRLARAVLGAWLLILVGVSVLGVGLAPLVVKAYAWGFGDDPGKLDMTVTLTRVMFPYILFMGLLAVATGILNVHGRFFTPAFAPFLWNVTTVAIAIALAPHLRARGIPEIVALAVGVLAGGAVQVAWQLPALARVGRLVWPSLDLRNPGLRRIFGLMIPMTFGFGVYQIDVLFSRLFASFLPEGSVSYLYYGMRLVDVPQAVFMLGIGAAVLPALSRSAAEGRIEDLKRSWADALGLGLWLAFPAAVALVILAEPICSVLFLRGRFDASMLDPTAGALACLAPGIVGTAGVRVTVPAFFARGDTRTPTVIGAVNLLVYLLACLVLARPFGHLGIAAAMSIAPLTQFAQLVFHLRRAAGPLGLGRLASSAARSLAGTAVMSGVLLLIAPLGRWDDSGSIMHNAAVLGCAVAAGGIAYLAVSRLLRSREMASVIEAAGRRAGIR